jgi:RimJ/RimL family protein N-acetyltransferase
VLTTERLLLREYEERDGEAVREIDTDPEVQRFRGGELVSEKEKLGMRREGHQRENQWLHGRWWDTLLYAILDHEWRTRAV